MALMPAGTGVVMQRLTSAPQYNGVPAVVLGYHRPTGRYEVKLLYGRNPRGGNLRVRSAKLEQDESVFASAMRFASQPINLLGLAVSMPHFLCNDVGWKVHDKLRGDESEALLAMAQDSFEIAARMGDLDGVKQWAPL